MKKLIFVYLVAFASINVTAQVPKPASASINTHVKVLNKSVISGDLTPAITAFSNSVTEQGTN